MADFNNFIPRTPPPKEPEDKHAQEVAALKQQIDVMERGFRLSTTRYTSWQIAEQEVRRLTQENRNLEWTIKGQEARLDRILARQDYFQESERAKWAGEIQQLTAQLESTSQETKDAIEAKHAQEIQDLKTEHNKKMTHLGESYQKNAHNQRMENGEKEKALKANHNAELKEIKKAHNESIAQHLQIRQQMNSALQNKTNEIKAMTIKYEEEKKRADARQEYKKKQSQQQYAMIAPRAPNPTQSTQLLPPQQQHNITVPGNPNPAQNNQTLPRAPNNLKRQQPHDEYQIPQNTPMRQRTGGYIPVQGSAQFMIPTPPARGPMPVGAIQQARNLLTKTREEIKDQLTKAVKHRAVVLAQNGTHDASIDAVLRNDPQTIAIQTQAFYNEIVRRARMTVEDAPAAVGSPAPMGVQNDGAFFVPGNQATQSYNGAGFGPSNAGNGM